MVPCGRSFERGRSHMPGLPHDHFPGFTRIEDSPALFELLPHHCCHVYGCKFSSLKDSVTRNANILQLGFVIPFGAHPEQCYDEITPNDMYSDLTCAFSGAFLISGGLSIAVWIFIRALSMHLQICWDVTPGRKFFYFAQGLGWTVAATFFTISITIT